MRRCLSFGDTRCWPLRRRFALNISVHVRFPDEIEPDPISQLHCGSRTVDTLSEPGFVRRELIQDPIGDNHANGQCQTTEQGTRYVASCIRPVHAASPTSRTDGHFAEELKQHHASLTGTQYRVPATQHGEVRSAHSIPGALRRRSLGARRRGTVTAIERMRRGRVG